MDAELFSLFCSLCEKDKDLVLELAREMSTSEDRSTENILRKLRQRAGLTAAGVARAASISEEAYRRYEQGDTTYLSWIRCKRIAQVFGCNVYWLWDALQGMGHEFTGYTGTGWMTPHKEGKKC